MRPGKSRRRKPYAKRQTNTSNSRFRSVYLPQLIRPYSTSAAGVLGSKNNQQTVCLFVHFRDSARICFFSHQANEPSRSARSWIARTKACTATPNLQRIIALIPQGRQGSNGSQSDRFALIPEIPGLTRRSKSSSLRQASGSLAS